MSKQVSGQTPTYFLYNFDGSIAAHQIGTTFGPQEIWVNGRHFSTATLNGSASIFTLSATDWLGTERMRASAKDAEYLSKLMSEDSSFKDLLPSRLECRIDQETLTLNRHEAELLRDYFTDRLAKVGFDENYEPNEEGVMLERLTDLLFLPDEKWVVG